jgi:cyclase
MVSKHFESIELQPGIYAAYATQRGAAFGNAAVIDLGEQTLVFDTFLTPQAGRDLRRFAQEITGRAPELVVNSHYHNDHTWGNQAFPEAQLISSTITRQQLETRGAGGIKLFQAEANGRLAEYEGLLLSETDPQKRSELEIWTAFFGGVVEALPELRLVLPSITFEQRLTLHSERGPVELLAYEGGHTASDTVLYLPEAGIVFMSDLLFIRCHPLMVDGNPERLKAVLNELMGLDAQVFVPGHGPAGTRADIQRLIDYVDGCCTLARGCGSEEEISLLVPPQECCDWKYQPFFQANMRFLSGAS